MERDGLVVVSPDDRRLELTEHGRSIAVRVMRKHRLAERLLTDVIGLDLLHVHDEACRWEHVMSDRVERRLLEILDRPERSPYGNAVPGLGELGAPPAPEYPAGAVSVHDLASAGGGRATLVRLGEHAQTAPGLLDAAVAAGVGPGCPVTVGPLAGEIVLEGPDGAVALVENAARHVFVLALED
jgi:DtxR family Mn-dependent transcriptional regulator